MLTGNQMQANVGKIGVYSEGGEIFFEVMITNSRNRFGNLDYQIEPVSGSGSRWVPSYKVREIKT